MKLVLGFLALALAASGFPTSTEQRPKPPKTQAPFWTPLGCMYLKDHKGPPGWNDHDKKVRVRFCDGIKFDGTCIEHVAASCQCNPVPQSWEERIRSVKLLPGVLLMQCDYYKDRGCHGKKHRQSTDPDLSDKKGEFDRAILSFWCEPKIW